MARISPETAEAFMLNAGYKPLEPYKKSHDKWKCIHLACGQIVFPTYHGLSQGQGGCFPCGRKASANKKRLSETRSVQMMLNANLEPLVPYTSTDTPWKSRCMLCGKVVQPRLDGIRAGQGGCKFCASKALGIRQTLSQEVALRIIKKANLEPLEPYKDSKTPWKCKCLGCGSIVNPRIGDVKNGGGGCRTCGTAKTARALTIPEDKALQIMIDADVRPTVPYPKAKNKWKSECLKCGRVIFPILSEIIAGHAGCSYCANRKKDPQEVVKFMLSVNLEPLEPYKNARSRWKCKCLKCGNVVYPQYNNVEQENGGCGFCSKKGINLNKPSYLYLITHEDLAAHKIGIGNVQEKIRIDRLKGNRGFISHGWSVYKIWHFKSGAEATTIETAVFRVIRKELKLPPYLSKNDMPKTRGESETIDAEAIGLVALEKVVNKVIKEASKVEK